VRGNGAEKKKKSYFVKAEQGTNGTRAEAKNSTVRRPIVGVTTLDSKKRGVLKKPICWKGGFKGSVE